MKNKTIIMGQSGSGKSYHAMEQAIKNKGTTIIVNGSCGKDRYKNDFPKLEDFISKDSNRSFTLENGKKYFIEYNSDINYSVPFVDALILGCDFGMIQNDKNAMVVFDDGSWHNQSNKLLKLWQYSHVKCGIIIVVDNFANLFDINEENLTDKMKNDILKYWNIIHCE